MPDTPVILAQKIEMGVGQLINTKYIIIGLKLKYYKTTNVYKRRKICLSKLLSS